MPRGKHTVIVLLLCLLFLVLTGLGMVLLLATWTEPGSAEWGVRGTQVFFAVTFTAVGAVVAGGPPIRLGGSILAAAFGPLFNSSSKST